MKSLLTDPVVLTCIGIIVVGIICFIWGLGQFRRLKGAERSASLDDGMLPVESDLRNIDFRAPAVSTAGATAAVSPAVSKEVAERLDTMTQRLAEMQSVLTKQSSAAGAAGGVGQGFSAETIDKLLKIIGNVIQQVDVLQKSMNTKEGGGGKPESSISPLTKL